MCLDCGFGQCRSNTSVICICDPGFSQSREMYAFPANYECNFDNPDICLPCNTREDVVFGLYLSTALLDAVLLFLLFWGKNMKQVLRWAVFIAGFVISLIACLLRAADKTRLFGEDVAFTLLLMLSYCCGVSAVLLLTERLLLYFAKVMVIYPSKSLSRKLIYVIIYSHWIVAVAFFGLSAIPVVAAAQTDLRDKSVLIKPALLISAISLLYVQVVHTLLYFRLARDLERIMRGNADSSKRQSQSNRRSHSNRKYIQAKKKLRLQRDVINALFTPLVVAYGLGFFLDEVYGELRYILPINRFGASVVSLIFMICYGPFKGMLYTWEDSKFEDSAYFKSVDPSNDI